MTSEMSDSAAEAPEADTPVNAETERATNAEVRIRLRLFTGIIISLRCVVCSRRPSPDLAWTTAGLTQKITTATRNS
jgi:hypothetical protein